MRSSGSRAPATDFPTLRTAGTGSWLGRSYQGKGLGTEMRAAILHLLFSGLDAVAATSGRRGERARIRHYVLTRERWEHQQRARTSKSTDSRNVARCLVSRVELGAQASSHRRHRVVALVLATRPEKAA